MNKRTRTNKLIYIHHIVSFSREITKPCIEAHKIYKRAHEYVPNIQNTQHSSYKARSYTCQPNSVTQQSFVDRCFESLDEKRP